MMINDDKFSGNFS